MVGEEQIYDVVIVGASIAGASLAVQLGAQGISVALIDKTQFPRRKACGEGLSDIALQALFRLGFSQNDIENLRGKSFYAYRLDFGKKSLRFATGKEDTLKGIGVQRYHLDTLLFGRASNFPSVNVFPGDPVRSYHEDSDLMAVTLKSGSVISGRYLVLADGANSMGAGKLGIPKTTNRKTHWGISYSLEGEYLENTGEVLVLLKNGFEVYCTPVSDSILNVALLTNKEHMPRLQNTELVKKLLAEVCEKTRFRGSTDERPIQVGPIGAKRPYHCGRALLLGDAAESFDPAAGMGMTHGLLMAEFAAKALTGTILEGVPEETAFNQYARESAEMSRPLRGFTRFTASLLRAPGRQYLAAMLTLTRLPYFFRKSLSERRPAIFWSLLKIAGS